MGNCQDQFHNVSQYQTSNDKSQVLIDRSHKRIFASKYQSNVGFLMQQPQQQTLDNQALHKSKPLQSKYRLQKHQHKKKHIPLQTPKLQLLDLKFYHSLGLPQYQYKPIPAGVSKLQVPKYIDEAQDRTGVIYIGQRNQKGRFHGNGVLKANTVKYIGQFFQGTKHYNGRQIYTNQVYEGEFHFDFRKGYGIRYTQQYIDDGYYDKYIIWGQRKFKNGNKYIGTFEHNKMNIAQGSQQYRKIINDLRYNLKLQFQLGQAYFYDASTNLQYSKNLVIQYDQLKQADIVVNKNKNKIIGSFRNGRIVPLKDEMDESRYNNSQRMMSSSYRRQNNKKESQMTQDEIIRKKIQQWE